MFLLNHFNGFNHAGDQVNVVATASVQTSGTNPADYGNLTLAGPFTHVFIITGGRGNAALRTITSVTYGGSSASLISGTDISDTRDRVAIYALASTTQNGNLTVTWSGTMNETEAYVIAVNGLLSLTPVATATDNTEGTGTFSVNTTSGGFLIAGQRWRSATAGSSTGLDTVSSISNTETLLAGHSLTPSTQSPKSVTITPGTSLVVLGASASFR